jgi:hypothetical protein
MTGSVVSLTSVANSLFIENNIDGDITNSYFSTVFDADNDGDVDIYVPNYSNQQNNLWINDGFGNFTGNNIDGDE